MKYDPITFETEEEIAKNIRYLEGQIKVIMISNKALRTMTGGSTLGDISKIGTIQARHLRTKRDREKSKLRSIRRIKRYGYDEYNDDDWYDV